MFKEGTKITKALQCIVHFNFTILELNRSYNWKHHQFCVRSIYRQFLLLYKIRCSESHSCQTFNWIGSTRCCNWRNYRYNIHKIEAKKYLFQCLNLGIVITSLPESPKVTSTTKGKVISRYSVPMTMSKYYQHLSNIGK